MKAGHVGSRTIAALVIMIPLLVGCGSTVIVDDVNAPIRNTHAMPGQKAYEDRAIENDCRIDLQYSDELRAVMNRRKRMGDIEPPESYFARGLALSGGGMRSASFTMGVFEALHANHQLEQIDIASSVSGGGYTLGWYLANMTDHGDDPHVKEELILSRTGPYQQHLGERADLTPPIRSIGYGFLDVLPGAFWNLFANGAFGWHVNTSPGRHFYDNRLRWIFMTRPDGTFMEVNWPELKTAAEAGTIPPFIVNTAVLLDDDPAHVGGKMSNLVYEFTPWHYGSDAFGYTPAPPPIDFPRAISISGGALDLISMTSGFSQKMFISALNVDIGYSMDNPTFERPFSKADSETLPAKCGRPRLKLRGKTGPVTRWERFWQVITPLPFYLGKPWYGRHKGGSRLYISDGGFADNLGAFSLIRRMTRQIIIVDAELEDPHHIVFNAYSRLKEAVRTEMDADLSVPTIDKILEGYGTFDPTVPVMAGTISHFPTLRSAGPVDLQIMYVKLSLNSDLSQYDPAVADYYRNGGAAKHFPYESTGDQGYSDERYRAYRELGYRIGQCIPKFGQFTMTDPPCYNSGSR
jgi:hypothetical protein